MSFFSFRQKTYPLIALFAGAVVLVFGLIGAKTVIASYFLIGVLCWYLLFGYYKQVLRILPAAVFVNLPRNGSRLPGSRSNL